MLPGIQRHVDILVCPVLDVSEYRAQDVHVEAVVAPTTLEYELRGQSMHGPVPVTVLYLPAAHNTHESASDPVEPALHVHVLAPFAENELTAHVVQTVAANTLENVPAEHVKHVDNPVVGDEVPGKQSRQVFTDVAPVSMEYLPAEQLVQDTWKD
ncbi:MAG: hypothetical protein EBR09_15005 [Proteobacteria bacterium]|nr:hypothetical protein [Pseudomonadota bacterium]